MLIILSVGTYRCAVKISIWGSLGVPFGILGIALAPFCNTFVVLGSPGSDLATESIFGHSPGNPVPPLGFPFGTQNLRKPQKNMKSLCPESSAEKRCSQRATESPFLSSLWVIFVLSNKLWFWDLNQRIKNKVRTSMENGHAVHPTNGVWTPERVEAERLEATS